MRILLTHSYFYPFDPKQWKAGMPYPPLGTLYAAAVLRECGYEIHLVDNALEKSTEKFSEALSDFNPDFVVIYDDGFNYLTKMCLTNMREAAFKMINLAVNAGVPVAVSSSDSTDHARLYLEKGASFIIAGEGEITLKELMLQFENDRKALFKVPGLKFFSENELMQTAPRQVLRNIDDLPDPAWDLVDMKSYRKIWMKNHGYFSLNISTTRGCPYKCNWCAKPIYGNRYNSRSPARVASEMKLLTEKFGAEHFWITDDIFGLKPNWVQEFESEIKRSELKIRYKIQSRVDLMLKDNNLRAMVNSGMDEVWVGAESGSQKILDAMDKGISVDQIRQATRLVKSYNKKICFFLQFGYIGENLDDIRKTTDLLLELMPDDIGVSVSYPLPGTGFYDKVKNDLKTKSNWTDSDDLDMMYKASFDRKFYKKLHRRIHKLYRRKQGIEYLMKPVGYWSSYRFPEIRSVLLSIFYYTPLTIVDQLRLKSSAN